MNASRKRTPQPEAESTGIILGWNRDSTDEDDMKLHAEELEICADGYTVEGQWSVGNRKNIAVGSHAFLLGQGSKHPRGILGHGTVTTRPFIDTHWADTKRTTKYVGVEWDGFLPFDQPIPINLLTRNVPSLPWKTGIQSSGFPIKSDVLQNLLHLWNTYVPLSEEQGPGELPPGEYWEGAVRTITVNRYERDPQARQACLDHHGHTCQACEADLTDTYGQDLGRRTIHVHHIVPMATRGKRYRLDPLTDLVPLCPNCHNAIHKTDPVMTPDEFRKKVIKRKT